MKKSFTLLELLIVLVVIGIIVVLALPKLEAFVYNMHGVEAMNNLRALADSVWRYYMETGNFPPGPSGTTWPDKCDIGRPRGSKYWWYYYYFDPSPQAMRLGNLQLYAFAEHQAAPIKNSILYAPIGGFYEYWILINKYPTSSDGIPGRLLGDGFYMHFRKKQKISNNPSNNSRTINEW